MAGKAGRCGQSCVSRSSSGIQTSRLCVDLPKWFVKQSRPLYYADSLQSRRSATQLKNLEYPEKTYSSQAKCLSRSPHVGRFSLRLCRWNTYQPNVAECLDKTLESLQTDYLDLYLIHCSRLVPNDSSALFPVNPDGTRAVDRSWNQQETWRQMEEIYKSGKVKAIGVSNWSVPYLEHLEKTWTIIPAVNQVCKANEIRTIIT
jgi:hypothetical protein